jgi:hypothetical protein
MVSALAFVPTCSVNNILQCQITQPFEVQMQPLLLKEMDEAHLDVCVADLENICSWRQESYYAQIGGMVKMKLDLGADSVTIITTKRLPQDEPLQARGVHNGELMDQTYCTHRRLLLTMWSFSWL